MTSASVRMAGRVGVSNPVLTGPQLAPPFVVLKTPLLPVAAYATLGVTGSITSATMVSGGSPVLTGAQLRPRSCS